MNKVVKIGLACSVLALLSACGGGGGGASSGNNVTPPPQTGDDNKPIRNIALATEKGVALGVKVNTKYGQQQFNQFAPFPPWVSGAAGTPWAGKGVDYAYYYAEKKLIDGDITTEAKTPAPYTQAEFGAYGNPSKDFKAETEGLYFSGAGLLVNVPGHKNVTKLVLHGKLNWSSQASSTKKASYDLDVFRVYKDRPVETKAFTKPSLKTYDGKYLELYSQNNPNNPGLDRATTSDRNKFPIGPQNYKAKFYSRNNQVSGYNGGGIALGHPNSIFSCFKGDASGARDTKYKLDPCNEGNGDVWCKAFNIYDSNGAQLDANKDYTSGEVVKMECILNAPLPQGHGLIAINGHVEKDGSAGGQTVKHYITEFEMYGR